MSRADLRGIAREPRAAIIATSVFTGWARDGAAAFGNADAATCTHAVFAAIVEGVRIIDDIQDREETCLATDVGIDRALEIAINALEHALELTAELPVPDASWTATAKAIGRGIRETAIGQQLEATADSYWTRIDRKTAPLVATALELGALVAGADPSRAAALTRLGIPLGRLLQIGDDCNDALDDDSNDWRTPHLNLLMSYTLAGPRAKDLRAVLGTREAQHLLLRDGALAYAIHAELATIDDIAAIVDALDLPHPAPFRELIARERAQCEALLRRTGVTMPRARDDSGNRSASRVSQ